MSRSRHRIIFTGGSGPAWKRFYKKNLHAHWRASLRDNLAHERWDEARWDSPFDGIDYQDYHHYTSPYSKTWCHCAPWWTCFIHRYYGDYEAFLARMRRK